MNRRTGNSTFPLILELNFCFQPLSTTLNPLPQSPPTTAAGGWGEAGRWVGGCCLHPVEALIHPARDLYTGVLHTLKTPATFKRISRHILYRLNLPFRRTNKCASISGACKFHSGPSSALSRLFSPANGLEAFALC